MGKSDRPFSRPSPSCRNRGNRIRTPMCRNPAVLLLCIVALTAISGIHAPRAAAVSTCRIGAYITDLYGLDVSPRTIDADFWLWSVCPSADLDATKRLEFVNATRVTQSDRSVEKVGDE